MRSLQVEPVKNFCFPAWVVLIPRQKNILIYLEDGNWRMIPETIPYAYAKAIGKKISKL